MTCVVAYSNYVIRVMTFCPHFIKSCVFLWELMRLPSGTPIKIIQLAWLALPDAWCLQHHSHSENLLSESEFCSFAVDVSRNAP